MNSPAGIIVPTNYVVFGYCGALTALTGILFGLAPALSASRINLNALKDGSRGSGGA